MKINAYGTPSAYPRCDLAGIAPNVGRLLLRAMLRIRRFEERIVEIYPAQEMRTPVHLCLGQEAIAAGICASIRVNDYLTSTHRNHGHLLAVGVPPASMYAEFYGKVTGCCRGKGGSMHLAYPDCGVLGTSAIVGGGIPIATGYGLAIRKQGRDAISVCFFGDGASEEGSFSESLGFAALRKLPVVYVCENNFYATNSPQRARQPHPDIHRRAEALGVPSLLVDGNDVFAVHRAGLEATIAARQGRGPTLIECRTYRWKGHVGPDCDWAKGCRPKEELDSWQARCPVNACKNALLRAAVVDEAWIDETHAAIETELDAAFDSARQSPFPSPEELTMHVFASSGEEA